jgi:hypothetical protein
MTDELPTRPRRTTEAPEEQSTSGAVVAPGVALNPTALALWELCDGITSTDEMVAAVSELFALPVVRARRDVETALRQMLATGAIR